jgi:methylenetetrahydrofolate dehydrogenase (NADP+)/methenyltetrahydrofolate cyclohydrolase
MHGGPGPPASEAVASEARQGLRAACTSLARPMAELIDGKAIAQQVRDEVRVGVEAWVAAGHEPPGLATILVGDDPASAVYVNGKQKASAEAGIRGFDHRLPEDATHGEVSALLHGLNADRAVNGILLQLPTPPQVDGPALTEEIAPEKDVDGLTPISTGLLAKNRPGLRPCTPLGIMELLRRHDVQIEGAEAVVVGRSDLVGKPASALLLQANATVTTAHSRTKNLAEVCARADILVAAVGVAHLIKGEWVTPGAVVIDVGMNRVDGKLTGDVEFESARDRARLITPVPGGVGPMTIAMLMRNTLEAAKAAAAR